jgi:hypothetical protein
VTARTRDPLSGGTACLDKEHKPQWYVATRNANYSAFNGGRRTRSAYSEVRCPACPTRWRSKAAYVDRLPDGDFD